MSAELRRLQDDGLPTPPVGSWGERKYRLVAHYAATFATSMKRKWQCRVYIDLFAGAGRVRLKGSKSVVYGSPLLALNTRDRFDRYVFAEEDPDKMSALKARIEALGLAEGVQFVPGNVNDSVTQILSAIPSPRRDYKVLAFCFVDPYKMGNLRFDTIKDLSGRYIDFLVLIPSFMDAHRDLKAYMATGNHIVEHYLGMADWREQWESSRRPGDKFGTFVADRFGKQMASLGFLYDGLEDMVEVRSDEKNLRLYHLAFFSRHELGRKFWRDAKKSSTDQRELPF